MTIPSQGPKQEPTRFDRIAESLGKFFSKVGSGLSFIAMAPFRGMDSLYQWGARAISALKDRISPNVHEKAQDVAKRADAFAKSNLAWQNEDSDIENEPKKDVGDKLVTEWLPDEDDENKGVYGPSSSDSDMALDDKPISAKEYMEMEQKLHEEQKKQWTDAPDLPNMPKNPFRTRSKDADE